MNRTLTLARVAVCAVVIASIAALGPALATAGSPKVEVTILVEREVVHSDAAGKQVVERKPVGVAHPGDVLVYTLKATNVGDAPALDANLEDPLPAGTELLLDSLDHGAAVATASLDGGKTWQSFPARVERKGADGKVETVVAPADGYTHLRWKLAGPLGPGESKDVRFKVRIR